MQARLPSPRKCCDMAVPGTCRAVLRQHINLRRIDRLPDAVRLQAGNRDTRRSNVASVRSRAGLHGDQATHDDGEEHQPPHRSPQPSGDRHGATVTDVSTTRGRPVGFMFGDEWNRRSAQSSNVSARLVAPILSEPPAPGGRRLGHDLDALKRRDAVPRQRILDAPTRGSPVRFAAARLLRPSARQGLPHTGRTARKTEPAG